jgi:hypothetical protein
MLQQLLQAKDRRVEALERQLEAKEKQLPQLLKAAAADSLRSEVAALRAALHQKEGATAAATARAAVLEGAAKKDAARASAAADAARAAANAAAVPQQAVTVSPAVAPALAVTQANYAVGRRVKRGPTWTWGNQDGGVGSLGTLLPLDRGSKGWSSVKWDTGRVGNYRLAANLQDLVYEG